MKLQNQFRIKSLYTVSQKRMKFSQAYSGVNKKDRNKKMILNLKKFKLISYKHFKMGSINNIVNLAKPNVYMTSIDLRDDFIFVPIHMDHQKYLNFYSTFFNLHICLIDMVLQ